MTFDEEGIVVGQLQAVNTAIDSSVFKVSTSTPSLFSPAPIGNPTRDPQLNIDVPFDGGISWGTQFAYKRPAKLSSTFSRELRILRTLLSADGQWFVVQPGDVISASTVADGSLKPMAMPKGGLPATSVTVGRDVWLGLALKESSPIPPEADRIHYGWLHLRFNLFGTPTLVDSVYTRRENGIVVGQKTRCAVCQP